MSKDKCIYVAYKLDKEKYALGQLIEKIKEKGIEVKELNFSNSLLTCDLEIKNTSNIEDFISCDCPIVLNSYTETYDSLHETRGNDNFVSVSIEHGISPFKKYSYSKEHLRNKYFFASTKTIAERLQNLSNAPFTCILSGYPQLHTRKDKISSLNKSEIRSKYGFDENDTIVTIFTSWDFNPSLISQLPDKHGIVFILHPDTKVSDFTKPEFTKVLISNNDNINELISISNYHIGDVSSITLECAALKIKTLMIVDSCLYSDLLCDIDADFFKKDSQNFLKVPGTNTFLDERQVITFDQLKTCLSSKDFNLLIKKFKSFDSYDYCAPEILPNMLIDTYDSICTILQEIVSSNKGTNNTSLRKDKFISNKLFLNFIYRILLDRSPDKSGLNHYIKKIEKHFDSPHEKLNELIAIYMDIKSSPESLLVAQKASLD